MILKSLGKYDLAKRMAEKVGITQGNAAKAIDAFREVVKEALANGEEIMIVGFGRWYTRKRNARNYRVPTSEGIINIPARRLPMFSFGAPIKDAVRDASFKKDEDWDVD